MLKWPRFHLAMLARQIRNDWSRLGSLLADPESIAVLMALHENMPIATTAQPNWLASDRAALRLFLESAERFNRNWKTYIDSLDRSPSINRACDFNQFYVLEKYCAFGSEQSHRRL